MVTGVYCITTSSNKGFRATIIVDDGLLVDDHHLSIYGRTDGDLPSNIKGYMNYGSAMGN